MLPGDAVLALPESGELRVGGGLLLSAEPSGRGGGGGGGDALVASRAGVLRQAGGGRLWVDGGAAGGRRYVPAEGEPVLGVVRDRMGDGFSVDIGGPFPALLPALAFEGATRRNRPALVAGDLVYARVAQASRDADPQLACVDAAGRAAGYGPLKEGFLVAVGTGLARALLAAPPHPALAALGASLQFEVAVGLNGRVWVHSPSPATTIFVANALSRAEGQSREEAAASVKAMLAAVC